MQSPLSPSTTQTLMQGVAIAFGGPDSGGADALIGLNLGEHRVRR